MIATADISINSQLKGVIQHALSQEMSIACWRLPLSNEIYISLSHSNPKKKGAQVEQESPGFYASPFTNPELKNTYFFPSDDLYILKDEGITKRDGSKIEFPVSASTLEFHHTKVNEASTTAFDYIHRVNEAINAIKNTNLNKVVLSKTKTIDKPNFNLTEKFIQLTQEYPNAFVSLISSPETGTWLGATPEILISIDRWNIFKTVALAGTQPYQGQPIKSAVWTQKEIEEQAYVSKHIIHCFKNLRLREFDDIGPKTVRAANLLHLKTEFLVDLNKVEFPDLGSKMLQLLHPTSAVCGTPTKEAQVFIEQYEDHDRELYSGFIGPVNIQDETHLFVNLRCMKIGPEKITYYAGAGLTEDSNADKEWQETEFKCKTLEAIIENA